MMHQILYKENIMKIKYVGPRPFINQHGIEFLTGKEDKYVYLSVAIQILKAIDAPCKDDHCDIYNYHPETKRYSDDEMLQIMNHYDNKLEEEVKKQISEYEQKLEDEIKTIEHRGNLSAIEKEAWVNNLKIMKNYRIQRAINKIYYMHAIDQIKRVVLNKDIKEINTPFYEKFFHVLETIRGAIESGRNSHHTELKVIPFENEQLRAKLFIT
jgi:hypothetical protein